MHNWSGKWMNRVVWMDQVSCENGLEWQMGESSCMDGSK